MLLRPAKKTSLPFIAALMTLAGSTTAPASELNPQIVKLVGSVSEERLGVLLRKLE